MPIKIKPEAISVESTNIFKNDKLDREFEITNLTSLVSSVKSPFVLSLNSPWGTGKTTFVRLWIAYLKSSGKPTVYFNAWESDFSDDPLLAFLGEIEEDFHTISGKSKELVAAWKKAKSIGEKIVRRSIPALVRIGTAGVLDASDFIEGEASDVASGLSQDSVEAYLSHKSAISQFRTSMANALAITGGKEPIVIFVDELDRCKPSYAILLLERIKHLFDVTGVIFVLSIDIDQLSHSIGAVYGQGFDSRKYLTRFIDVEYSLALPGKKKFIENLYSVYDMETFFSERRTNSSLQFESSNLCDTFEMMSRWAKTSLREIEQLFSRINLVLRATPSGQYLHPDLVAFLIVFRYKEPKSYEAYIEGQGTKDVAIKYLKSISSKEEREANVRAAVVEGLIISAKNPHIDESSPVLAEYMNTVQDETKSHEEKTYSERVVNVAVQPTHRSGSINLGSIVQRVGMFAKFNLEYLDT